MKEVRTQDAVGRVICHDITRIIPGGVKEVAFAKGHVVREEDVDELLKVGKMHLYVWENDDTKMHENDAADAIYELIADENMKPTPVKEGKINVLADKRGLFVIDNARLEKLNSIGEIAVATRHDYSPVREGDMLAGTRVVPLVIDKDKIELAREEVRGDSVLKLIPYVHKKVGIVVTGSEVYEGLIEDGFSPVVRQKMQEYDAEVMGCVSVPDDPKRATEAIEEFIDSGADVVFVTGGMSVDPDDKTPLAIKNTGAEVVTYGTPVLPGTMFMLAYKGEVAIMGLPGCVMHSKRTVFDLVAPRVMADVRVNAKDIINLGKGGLCLSCETCIYPNCGFGSV